MTHINIKKGHDLRIFCQPDKYIVEITNFETGKSVYCTEPSGTFFEMEELN